jgi:3-deoxy-D-manno-octulosonic-acid transferase
MYLVYSVLFSLGIVLTAPYFLWRLRGRLASGARWRERFGFLPSAFRQSAPSAVWIHAVSVGETLAVAGLVRAIQKRYPERKIFLSHVTPAGREAGEGRLPGLAGQFFLPLDWRFSVRRAINHIRPALLLIVETELWPNLLRAAHESGARVMLVNARLSDRSFRRYRLVRRFMGGVMNCIDWICAQSATDAERFVALGAPRERVTDAGNLKFDSVPPRSGELAVVLRSALPRAQRSPVIVAASTMPGEEALLLPAWAAVRRRHPRALLILAPRHPNRFETVAQLLENENHSLLRRTGLESDPGKIAAQIASPEVFLLDSIGELAGIFELADLVFMGGSLVPTGGHNLLEPAYWAKAIVFGPYMHNFRDIAQLFLQGGAAVQVPDAEALTPTFLDLLTDGGRRTQLGAAAKRVLEQESGATERTLESIAELLETRLQTDARE